MSDTTLDLLIVGAGPAGLATAIAAKRHWFSYLVIDKGGLVDGIFRFPTNMVFFTTPELLEIGGLPFVTPYDKPTRAEALRYYRRVVDTYDLTIAFDEEVVGIARETGGGDRRFAVSTRSRLEEARTRTARAVVLATGYYGQPNRLGVPGEDLAHVSHFYTEAHPYYRKRVVVVGGKNSAAEAALELYRSGARVSLVHRGPALGDSIKYWVKPDIENRIAEGSIPAYFQTAVRSITQTTVHAVSPQGPMELPADAVFLLTGYHPDLDLLARAGVQVDAERRLAPYNPETMETNVPGLYLAGGVVSGRDTAPVFIENGRLHGETIVRTLKARL
ncbi:MAG: YpdA family putative bacillithiol disulfide reductase [Acidobacteria bacterium]|nr:YpdA family putative bacillithiol disulfide reductase [Acidobacteriota bacterium]